MKDREHEKLRSLLRRHVLKMLKRGKKKVRTKDGSIVEVDLSAADLSVARQCLAT